MIAFSVAPPIIEVADGDIAAQTTDAVVNPFGTPLDGPADCPVSG